MRVLLTGSSGWLGRFLAPVLRDAGHAVTGLDVTPGVDTDLVGTVADRALVDRGFAEHDIEAVVHAGALHKPDIARFPAQRFVDVNVTGTLNLLEAAERAGHDRFVMTSSTSLMITRAVRDETSSAAAWLDESFAPLAPRNIYGVTKLAAESLCRMHALAGALNAVVLRTSRFFPEEDDTDRDLTGPNLKASEFLHRRLTVEDAARAHLVALERAPELGFGLYVVSAPTPFDRADAHELRRDAAAVIERRFPDAAELYGSFSISAPHAPRPTGADCCRSPSSWSRTPGDMPGPEARCGSRRAPSTTTSSCACSIAVRGCPGSMRTGYSNASGRRAPRAGA